MQIKTLSPSKLKAARLCEARLLARLEDEDYSEHRGEAAAAGTLAHEAAKIWYRNEGGTKSDPGEVFREAIEACSHGRFGNENPRDNDGVQEARTLFDNIISFYRRESVRVVFAERRYKGTIKGGVPVHLIIDLALDLGNGRLQIVDFKTGYIKMTTDEMWSEDQVLMNLFAVTSDPELQQYKEVSFIYYWVRTGDTTGPVALHPDQLRDYGFYLQTEYQRLLNVTPETATERINPYCQSCGRRFECTAYRELITEAFNMQAPAKIDPETGEPERDDKGRIVYHDSIVTPEQVKELTLEQMVEQYSRLSNQLKLLEKSKSSIQKAILSQHERNDQRVIEVGDWKSTRVESSQKSFSTETVLTLARNRGISPATLVSPSQKRVENAFSGDQEAQALLNQTASSTPKSAFIKVSSSSAKKQKDKAKKKAEEQGKQ